MRHIVTVAVAAVLLAACGGAVEADDGPSPGDSPTEQSPSLDQAKIACDDFGQVLDDGRTLVLDLAGSDADSGYLTYGAEDIQCILDELGAPEAVWVQMGQTRALDGRQETQWDEFDASWTYHPDSGLDVLITTS